MAQVTYSVGEPTYRWIDLLDDVLRNGTVTVTSTLVTITSGTHILRFSGTGFVTNGTVLTAGTVSSIQLLDGAQLVGTESAFVTKPTFTSLNNLLSAYHTGTQAQQLTAYEAAFANESLNITGSAQGETFLGSRFADTINVGTAGPNDGNFVNGSYGADTLIGGNSYDMLSFMRVVPINLGAVGAIGVTFTMDTSGIGGGGKATGTFAGVNGGIVNSTFTNFDRFIGTNGNDTFIADPGSTNSQTNDVNWIGGSGNDKFVDNTDRDQTDFRINYDAEKFEDHGAVGNGNNVWGDVAGEIGVIVNMSAATITANVGAGVKTVLSGTGIDTYGMVDTIIGVGDFRLTDTKDYFVASAGGSNIQARGGDDTLIGGDGRDQLQGDEGNDTINAGDGNDDIDGGLGNDTINAGAGDFDYINVSNGTDTINGAAGYDMLAFDSQTSASGIVVTLNNTGAGNGTITGTFNGAAVNTTFQQIERVRGSIGNDIFIANAGFINTEDANSPVFNGSRGNAGAFHFAGSDGADTYTDNSGLAGGVVAVNYDEEQWTHTNFNGDHTWGTQAGEFGVIVNASAAVINVDVGRGLQVVAAGHAADTFNAADVLVNIKMFEGTNANDYVAAGAAGVLFDSREGNDRFVGGIGDDEFRGQQGNDTATGGAGSDQLNGDDGNDDLRGGDGNDQVNGGNDNDTLFGDNGNDNMNGDDGIDAMNGGAGADNMSGGNGNDTLNGDAGNDELRGDSGLDTLVGGAGNDQLQGGSENDMLNGGSEADKLWGDDGNDTLNGGTGADEMSGGLGDDTFFVDNIGDKVFEFGSQGYDRVNSSISYTVASGIESVTLTGAANLDVIGRADQGETITGNTGNNILSGFGGADTLSGLAGIDTLNGGDGIDVLKGGLGNDILTGGTGTDFFVFDTAITPTSNIDVITDFSIVDDTIRLENAIFTTLTVTGTLAATAFKNLTTGGAVDADDRILYDNATGALYYDSDGSGATAAIQFATLTAGPTVLFTDFVVI